MNIHNLFSISKIGGGNAELTQLSECHHHTRRGALLHTVAALLLAFVVSLSFSSCSKDYDEYSDLDSRSTVVPDDSTSTVQIDFNVEGWKDPVNINF